MINASQRDKKTCVFLMVAFRGRNRRSRKHAIYAATHLNLMYTAAQLQKVSRSVAEHLEGVVLGGDLLDEVVADEGNLLHNVLSHLGDVGKEEEGEDTSNGTEASSGGTAIRGYVSKLYETRLKFGGSRVVGARS